MSFKRLIIAIAIVCTAILCIGRADWSWADEPAFPYRARVVAEQAVAHSGPGEGYYATSSLPPGQVVEVYRQDADDWLAVRPPEGSFSWVAAREVRLIDGDLAEVIGGDVTARVGSAVHDDRDVIHVRLDPGERIQVLAAARIENEGAPETWYQIAPPAGEFRWVHARFLKPIDQNDRQAEAYTFDESNAPRATSNPTVRLTAAANVEEPNQFPAPAPLEKPRSTGAAEIDLAPMYQNADEEILALDLALSSIVAEDESWWDFRELTARAERLLTEGETTLQRGRARLLLEKINRFEDIRRRYERLRQTSRDATADIEADLAPPQDPAANFDGVGRLVRAALRTPDGPRYALLDDRGDVAYYVTPAPDVNLRNYLGRRIGVTGERRHAAETGAEHVTAKHVRPLENR